MKTASLGNECRLLPSLGANFMAVTLVRKCLLAMLLLLFCTENMALASVFEAQATATTAYERVAPHQDAHYLMSLLAEESEERQERDDALLPFEREVLHPHDFPLIETWKVAAHSTRPVNARIVPFYTLHRTLII